MIEEGFSREREESSGEEGGLEELGLGRGTDKVGVISRIWIKS
jgi:hypothetical protein